VKKETQKSLNRLWGLLPILLILFVVFVCNFCYDFVLKKYGSCGTAVLIDEKIYSKTSTTLYYEFHYGNKISKGNSQEHNLNKVGDSIRIIYLKSFPIINRALEYFDAGEIKCDCNQ
jgi:hypothetical protein